MNTMALGIIMIVIIFAFAGCSAKTVQDAGIGMQYGSSFGTALGGTVLGAGIVTELIGKGLQNDEPAKPGTPEYEEKKMMIQDTIRKGEFINRFKQQLNITSETTPVQINAAAVSVCADIDKMVESKDFLKVRKKVNDPNMAEIADGEEGEFYLIKLDKNPFGTDCVKTFEKIGARFVKRALEKESK